MKRSKSAYLNSLIILVLLSGVSCVRYIDKASTPRTTPVMQGALTFYKDSNILVYKSNVGVSMDNEKYAARPFFVSVPKGLVSYQFSNAQSFAFYYKREQAISIVIDLSNRDSKIDTTYEPNELEINKYLAQYVVDSKLKFNLQNIGYKSERKQLMIKKDGASILLYNIEEKNIKLFVSLLGHFKFL